MKGLTYYKQVSPFSEDITKNGPLDACEVDRNFSNLSKRDIEDIYRDGNNLVVKLKGGELITKEDMFKDFAKGVIIEYNEENGKLYLTNNGVKTEVGTIKPNLKCTVATDSTLVGDGSFNNPLGVNKLTRTGVYAPVKQYIDRTTDEQMPDSSLLEAGHRVVTKETTSPFGLLYNYNAVRQISCHLRESKSEWRIPTKEEWDEMLNAIEPNESSKKHMVSTNGRDLGEFAGKLLKSKDHWNAPKDNGSGSNQGVFSNMNTTPSCPPVSNTCVPTTCGTSSVNREPVSVNGVKANGINKYGFNALPAGYADDGRTINYFGERASFWSSTNSEFTSVFTKRLEYNKASVYQEITPAGYYMSLRLVKDYNGTNLTSDDTILGRSYPTVLMPSTSGVSKIWTAVNVDLVSSCYESLVPNNGVNLPKLTVFYINEWDGNKWVRMQLKEGESVTLVADGEYVDYVVIDGELVDKIKLVSEKITNKVQEKLNMIDAKAVKANEGVAENARRLDAVEQELGNINTSITTIEGNITTIKADIARIDKAEEITALQGRATALEAKAVELEGKIHIQEGSTFNKDTGELILKSNDGKNDVVFNLGFNFGDI